MKPIWLVKSIPTRSGSDDWRQANNRDHIDFVAASAVETILWGLPETDVE